MQISDAANILGLNGDITPEITKNAFREAAKKYHPDVNPAGDEMMKVINDAYDTLKDYNGSVTSEQTQYPDALNDALMAIMPLSGIHIEICGAWVWVTGDTYNHKDVFKGHGFKFAGKKKAWHFRPENWKSRSRGNTTMDDIRNKYGSTSPIQTFNNRLTKAGS